MAENRMAEVVKLLDVEIDEEFLIFNDNGELMGRFKFDDKNLWGMGNGNMGSVNSYLIRLFNGDWTIKKLPWKPKIGERFFSFFVNGGSHEIQITSFLWTCDFSFQLRYRHGFCYKTRQEAEADKPRAEKFFLCNEIIDWEAQQNE